MTATYQAQYKQIGDMIDHTPGSAVGAGDVIVLGSTLVCFAKSDIAANELGALCTRGVVLGVKDNSDVTGVLPAYWDDDGDPVGGTAGTGAFTTDSTKGPFAGWFLEVAGTSVGTVLVYVDSRDSAVTLARSAIVQQDDVPYTLTVNMLRVWDAPATVLPATPANDDLGIIYNTFGTAPPSVETGDVKATTTTRRLGMQFVLPAEYVAGQSITVRLNAGMKTTVSDTSATIDVECHKNGAGADICATAAQSINNLTAANKDFTITPTGLAPGDVLDIRVSIAVVDSATGTAVIGKLNLAASAVLLDVKG